MKRENRIVIAYAMLLVLLLLMLKLMTGVVVHEVLGVGLVLLAAAHLSNSQSSLKSMGKRRRRSRFMLNTLLLLSLLSTVISGAMLSVALFRFLNIPYHEIFYTIHTMSAQVLLVLSVVHLVLHMKSIAAFFRKRKQAQKEVAR
jgi:hypothetical protein